MRSVLVFGGLAAGVALLILSGRLPRIAGAAATGGKGDSPTRPRLELRYADFETEQGLLRDRPERPPQESRTPSQAVAPSKPQLAGAPPAATQPAPHTTPPVENRPPADTPEPPIAEAGPDQVVWIQRNELVLDGGGSSGAGLTYAWTQVSGPTQLQIADAHAAKTVATGLVPAAGASPEDGKYEFELTVTDREGRTVKDTARYTVRATPTFSIRPRAKSQLAYRDGYLLAHYEVWKSNAGDGAETFELRAPGELFIQQIGGRGVYVITPSLSGTEHVYQITVYYRANEPSTWLEFFVDTPDRIPAVVTLGVTWE